MAVRGRAAAAAGTEQQALQAIASTLAWSLLIREACSHSHTQLHAAPCVNKNIGLLLTPRQLVIDTIDQLINDISDY